MSVANVLDTLLDEAATALLRVDGLCVEYDGIAALGSVNLGIADRKVTALIGPSGCGKTSFLLSLNRLSDLIDGCTVRGSVVFDGEVIDSSCDPRALRRRIGMVFQRPNPFPLSLRDNLRLPLREHGCPRSEVDDRIHAVLERVGLWKEVESRLDAPALSLSGGQQQRLCIARALTLSPRLLLMDEPCSALDVLASEHIERLILELGAELGIVIVTHNLAQARRIADDVAVFWRRDECGRLIESGRAQRVFEAPREPETVEYFAGLRG